jgi:hypothetical protein
MSKEGSEGGLLSYYLATFETPEKIPVVADMIL